MTDARSRRALAVTVLVVGAGVGAAATPWYVDDGDGTSYVKMQTGGAEK